jgi:alkylation response protein AidB-like acyl-CoA dehydrogenase
MAQFIIDKRDLEFVLKEQLRLHELTQFPKFKDSTSEDFDLIFEQGVRLAQEVLAPINRIGDIEGSKLVDGQVMWPKAFVEAYNKYREAGLIAIAQSTEFGGMGLPMPLSIALGEVLMGACVSFMFLPGLTAFGGHCIENYGTQRLRELVVPKLYSGQWSATMCLTEPQAGTDVGSLTTSATPADNERYKIKGQKIFISAGDNNVTENIIHLVLARVPGDPAGTKGISLFAVPKYRFNEEGKLEVPNDVQVTSIEHKMGIHASPTCSLAFGENDECYGYLIGSRCQGLVYMFQMMNEARITCGVQGAASANATYQMALEYAKGRVQGAKVTEPNGKGAAIIEHPDVRRNLMLAKAMAEGIRVLMIKTGYYAELAMSHPEEHERVRNKDLVDLLTPVCKAFATDQGFRVTELAIQILGGYGYIREFGVEQYMRDVKIASIYEGTNGVQALDLLGRKMRLKDGALFMTWLLDINGFIERAGSNERLKYETEALEQYKNMLVESAMHLGVLGKKDPELAIYYATPFLEMFGYVEVGQLLLDQALIADAHRGEAFYDNKLKTVHFYMTTILPRVKALGQELQASDRSALDITL